MNPQILTSVLLVSLFASGATAATVNQSSAMQSANKFLSARGRSALLKPVTMASVSRGTATSTSEAIHIFNIGNNEGYIVISGDDRAQTVLAYSNNGSIDPYAMPDGCRAWLMQYAGEISSLQGHESAPSLVPIRYSTSVVEPMLDSRWNQQSPYNRYCPVDVSTGKLCVTGCVATATAQVMYYYRYPAAGSGTVTYEDRKQNNTVRSLDFSTLAPFDWENMTSTYNESSTSEQCDAVASLMHAVGHGTKMQYSSDTSVAYHRDAGQALIDYFGYDRNIHYYERASMSDQEWTDIITSELENGRPVIYDGKNPSMGHTFVCDGYDGNGYFHFNWGWSGLSDGYYSLSALTPPNQSTGGSDSGYTLSQALISNIAPSGTGTLTPQSEHLLNIDKLYFRDASSYYVAADTPELHTSVDDAQLFFYSFNKGFNKFNGEVCAAIVSDNGITPITITAVDGLGSNNYQGISLPLAGATIADGTHLIGFYYRNRENSQWHRISASSTTAPSECYITISGKDVTLRPHVPAIAVSLASGLSWNHLLTDAPATWSFEIANTGDVRLEGFAGVALTDVAGVCKSFYVTPVLCPTGETTPVEIKATLKDIPGGNYKAFPFYAYTNTPTANDIIALSELVDISVGQISIAPETGSYLQISDASSPLAVAVTNKGEAAWEGKIEGEIIRSTGDTCNGTFSADVAVGANSTATAMLKGSKLDLERGNYILNLYIAPGRDLLLCTLPLLVTSHISAITDVNADKTQIHTDGGVISIKSTRPLSAVTLHDIAGRCHLRSEADGYETAIATDRLAEGIYLLTIISADGSHEVKKITVRTY